MVADPDSGSDEAGSEDERVLRPEATVLPEEALLPETNVIRPPPNRFTHELSVDEPYRLDTSGPGAEAAGTLAAGTEVALLVEAGERCRVADAQGLYVEVRRGSLARLPGS